MNGLVLVIKVELWPYGDEARKEVIATGVIANDGTGTSEVGRYDAHFAMGEVTPETIADMLGVLPTDGRATHRRSESVWKLLHKALHDWLGKRR